jgi:hypothetical protein
MFITTLRLEAEQPGYWVLLEPLIWDSKLTVIVPKGFRTDLASIPRLFRWLLQQNGKSRRAAVLHDFLYRHHKMSRKDADALFHTALTVEKVNPVGRWLYWAGVRAGGWIAYGHKR